MEEAQTDTTVVPRGVVAAMKALREKQGITEGMLMSVSLLFITCLKKLIMEILIKVIVQKYNVKDNYTQAR